MQLIERFRKRVEDNCREVIDGAHPRSVEAVGGLKDLGFEICCEPRDKGLIIGAPGRQGTDPHSHTRSAAVWAGEKPLPAAGTIVVRAAEESAMAGEGVAHD
jgi:hypothetical protein